MENRHIFGHASSTIGGLVITRIRRTHGKSIHFGHLNSTIGGLIIHRIRRTHGKPIHFWPCELNNRWNNKHQTNETTRNHVVLHVGGRTVGWQGWLQHMFTWPPCVLCGKVLWWEKKEDWNTIACGWHTISGEADCNAHAYSNASWFHCQK